MFFDLEYSKEENSEESKSNRDEAIFIEGILTEMLRLLGDCSYF